MRFFSIVLLPCTILLLPRVAAAPNEFSVEQYWPDVDDDFDVTHLGWHSPTAFTESQEPSQPQRQENHDQNETAPVNIDIPDVPKIVQESENHLQTKERSPVIIDIPDVPTIVHEPTVQPIIDNEQQSISETDSLIPPDFEAIDWDNEDTGLPRLPEEDDVPVEGTEKSIEPTKPAIEPTKPVSKPSSSRKLTDFSKRLAVLIKSLDYDSLRAYLRIEYQVTTQDILNNLKAFHMHKDEVLRRTTRPEKIEQQIKELNDEIGKAQTNLIENIKLENKNLESKMNKMVNRSFASFTNEQIRERALALHDFIYRPVRKLREMNRSARKDINNKLI